MSLCVFVLIASEFLPVSLLRPIATDLAMTEGQAGQAISVSGIFAVLTSLFISSLTGRLDRKVVLVAMTGLMIASGVIVSFAPNYAVMMIGRALLGVVIGGFWSNGHSDGHAAGPRGLRAEGAGHSQRRQCAGGHDRGSAGQFLGGVYRLARCVLQRRPSSWYCLVLAVVKASSDAHRAPDRRKRRVPASRPAQGRGRHGWCRARTSLRVVVADKGYHSRAQLKALERGAWKMRIAEPQPAKGYLLWHRDEAARKAVYGNRTPLRSAIGRETMRLRGELVERSFSYPRPRRHASRLAAWTREHQQALSDPRRRVQSGRADACAFGQGTRREAAEALQAFIFVVQIENTLAFGIVAINDGQLAAALVIAVEFIGD